MSMYIAFDILLKQHTFNCSSMYDFYAVCWSRFVLLTEVGRKSSSTAEINKWPTIAASSTAATLQGIM